MNRITIIAAVLAVLAVAAGLALDVGTVAGATVGLSMAAVALPYREVWYASPVVDTLDTDTQETNSITMNKGGTVDLERFVGFASINQIAAAYYPTHNVIRHVVTQSLKISNTDPLLIGTATGTLTAAFPMDPRRNRSRAFPFGTKKLGVNETIDISVDVQGTLIDCDFAFAVPGTSGYRNERPPKSVISRPCQILGATDEVQIAADDAADTITMTTPHAGWVWLDALNLAGIADSVAATEETPNVDALGVCAVTAYTLPGEEQLIQGTGTGAVSAAVYDGHNRFHWIQHGWKFLSQGQSITLSVQNRGPDIVNLAPSLPFWRDDSGRGGGC